MKNFSTKKEKFPNMMGEIGSFDETFFKKEKLVLFQKQYNMTKKIESFEEEEKKEEEKSS